MDDTHFNYWEHFAAATKDELAMSVGRLAIVWSRLELITYLLTVGLTRGKAKNTIMLVASTGNRTIIDFFHTFADSGVVKTKGFSTDLSVIATELSRLLALRNRIVHGQWDPDITNPFINTVMRFKGKVRIHEEEWTPEQIDQVTAHCADLHCAIMDFSHRHRLMGHWNRAIDEDQKEDDPPRPAAIQNRDPKMTELVRRALS